MIDAALLDEMRDLVLAIAPERKAAPLYVINQPATSLPAPSDVIAYVNQGSAAIQEHLESIGKWQGSGPTIVFVKQDLSRDEVIVSTLHEGAHLCPYSPPPRAVELTPSIVEADRESLRTWCIEPEPRDDSIPLWVTGWHGKDFIRIALHFWWRCAMLGEVVPFDYLCAGDRYGLSPPICYWRGIGSEAVKMRDKSFAEILATDPPEKFLAWWRYDLRQWMDSNPEAVEERMKVVA